MTRTIYGVQIPSTLSSNMLDNVGFTFGKTYWLTEPVTFEGSEHLYLSGHITDDNGLGRAILFNQCVHIHYHNWRLIERPPTALEVADDTPEGRLDYVREVARDAEVVDLTDVPLDDPRHPEYEPPFPPTDGAIKYDVGKSPVMTGCVDRFPRAMLAIGLVSDYGRRKYGTLDGWTRLSNAVERYTDAMGRHGRLRVIEGEYDIHDSGLPHLAQQAWNALAILEMSLANGTIEAVPGNDIVDGNPILNSNGVKDD